MYICFFFFEKQVKRIMTAVFQDNKKYRVWSLAGQGFLKLTTKNGAKSAECSGIGNEPESNTQILLIILLWVFNFL